MIYLDLFLTFLKISFFNFGGGYAMISIIQNELISNQWLTSSEFANIIAISQITPGALAINSATFVGFSVAGVLGAFVATAAIPMPSLFFSIIISQQLQKFKDNPIVKGIFYGIRPVVIGLIINAVILVAETSILQTELSKGMLSNLFKHPLQVINIGSIIILCLIIIAAVKYKVNSIQIIIGSAILGVIVFSIV